MSTFYRDRLPEGMSEPVTHNHIGTDDQGGTRVVPTGEWTDSALRLASLLVAVALGSAAYLVDASGSTVLRILGPFMAGACIATLAFTVGVVSKRRRRTGPEETPGREPVPSRPTHLVCRPAVIDLRDLEWRRRVQGVVNAAEFLTTAFQPIFDISDLTCVGFEALARLPEMESPAGWFSEAYELGLGFEVEMLAVRRAVESAPPGAVIAVNCGPMSLQSRELDELIRSDGVDASRLILELTEHAVVDDYPSLTSALAGLRERGARVAIDDTGSGFASLRHVLALKPDIVKLDRSLIADIDRDTSCQELVRSLANFSQETGVVLVAEGVERAEELELCRDLGVDWAQGYLLGRPQPAMAASTVTAGAVGQPGSPAPSRWPGGRKS